MGEITGFGHFAINAKNWDKTLWFYGEILGLQLSETINMGDYSLVYATVPGGGKIELFQSHQPLADRIQKDEQTFGFRHFAFKVSGVVSLREKLINSGTNITLDLIALPKLNARVLLCEDPNGVILEFSEKLL